MNNQDSHTYLTELREKIYRESSEHDLAPDYDIIACELLNVIDELLPEFEDIRPGREEEIGHG